MSKNNYIIQKEKQIAELRKIVRIDTAYIGCGFVCVLHDMGKTDEEIADIMQKVNDKWVEIYASNINPLKYCKEQTGFELLTDEQERETINSYFEE